MTLVREDYFEAALDILATAGHRSVTMTILCEKLGVTTGSYYHYFGSAANFVPEFLKYWASEQSRQVVESLKPSATRDERIRDLASFVLQLPHAAEHSIRAWSDSSPLVAEYQRRVDTARFEAARCAIEEFEPDIQRARVLAVMAVSILVGVQSWRAPVDQVELRTLISTFEELLSTSPQPIPPGQPKNHHRTKQSDLTY